jgi:large subunit ribosomal protein L1
MASQKDALKKAVATLRDSKQKRNFNQSIELVMKLKDIDVKKPESRIETSIEIPNQLSKEVKICVLATGDLALRAKKGGADRVIGREEIEEIAKNKKNAKKLITDFDFFIAEAPLMPLIGKSFGMFLGPRGKMPTPVPPNVPIEDVIARHRKMVRIRVREQPAVRCRVATEDMKDEKIIENIQAVISGLESKLTKGEKNIASILLKATMSKPVKVGSKR